MREFDYPNSSRFNQVETTWRSHPQRKQELSRLACLLNVSTRRISSHEFPSDICGACVRHFLVDLIWSQSLVSPGLRFTLSEN
jgi:hypothetical protein